MNQPQRRTQEERSYQTRHKLLDGVISCLIADGYNSITTPEVCRRSGMSQGAIFKHFPTKNDLVTAAIGKLYDQLIEVFETTIEHLPPEGDRIQVYLTALWKLFDTPALLAIYDLRTAARTDPALGEALAPLEAQHQQKIRDIAAGLFPDAALDPRFFIAVDLILNVIQGAAVGNLTLPDPEFQPQREEALLTVAHHLLGLAHE